MKYSFLIIACLMLNSSRVFCQQQLVPGTELQELVKIAEVYAHLPNLWFAIYTTYADALDEQNFVDSSEVQCWMSDGRILFTTTDFEMLLGKEYSVYVDKIDSVVVVKPVADNKTIFQIPLLDPAFREAHVDTMYTFTVNDSLRVMRVEFKPESIYLEYLLQYDQRTGLLYGVNFHSRNENSIYPVPADHIVCATVSMSNYDFVPNDPSIFNEYRYFYKLDGNLFLHQEWAQYHLQN